jgi:hypothetical protein
LTFSDALLPYFFLDDDLKGIVNLLRSHLNARMR